MKAMLQICRSEMAKVFEVLRQSAHINFEMDVMFFLRCAFWLSVVYSTMTWTNIGSQPRDLGAHIADAGRAISAEVVNKAVAGATEYCARRVSECALDAERLTALVVASESSLEEELGAGDVPVHSVNVPMPVPDPRRARDANRGGTL